MASTLKELILSLCSACVRLLLQYFVQFWAPKYTKDLDILDKDSYEANQGLDGAQVID